MLSAALDLIKLANFAAGLALAVHVAHVEIVHNLPRIRAALRREAL